MSRIVLGVGGGIAAYKAADLLRKLVESGHDVTVVPTESALRFVGAPTWAALSHHPVTSEVWTDADAVPHVQLGRSADLETKGTLEGGGFKLDGMGGVGVGLKDQEAFTATLDENWHLKLGGAVTAVDVVGVKGSLNLDIDLPKVGNEIASGASWLYNGAASAATAFGETYARAVQDNPMMFVP